MYFITLHYKYTSSYCLACQVLQWLVFYSGLVGRFFLFFQRCFPFLVLLLSVLPSSLDGLIREITAILYRQCSYQHRKSTLPKFGLSLKLETLAVNIFATRPPIEVVKSSILITESVSIQFTIICHRFKVIEAFPKEILTSNLQSRVEGYEGCEVSSLHSPFTWRTLINNSNLPWALKLQDSTALTV